MHSSSKSKGKARETYEGVVPQLPRQQRKAKQPPVEESDDDSDNIADDTAGSVHYEEPTNNKWPAYTALRFTQNGNLAIRSLSPRLRAMVKDAIGGVQQWVLLRSAFPEGTTRGKPIFLHKALQIAAKNVEDPVLQSRVDEDDPWTDRIIRMVRCHCLLLFCVLLMSAVLSSRLVLAYVVAASATLLKTLSRMHITSRASTLLRR